MLTELPARGSSRALWTMKQNSVRAQESGRADRQGLYRREAFDAPQRRTGIMSACSRVHHAEIIRAG